MKAVRISFLNIALFCSIVVVTGSVDDPLAPVTVARRLSQFLIGPHSSYIEFEKGVHAAVFMAPTVSAFN